MCSLSEWLHIPYLPQKIKLNLILTGKQFSTTCERIKCLSHLNLLPPSKWQGLPFGQVDRVDVTSLRGFEKLPEGNYHLPWDMIFTLEVHPVRRNYQAFEGIYLYQFSRQSLTLSDVNFPERSLREKAQVGHELTENCLWNQDSELSDSKGESAFGVATHFLIVS